MGIEDDIQNHFFENLMLLVKNNANINLDNIEFNDESVNKNDQRVMKENISQI